MGHDEATKNHPGGVCGNRTHEKLARMNETHGENDGYKAPQYYLSKLNPECDAFFQYPKKNWNCDEVWYEARPIGVNKLDTMMKSTSEAAKQRSSPRCTPITVSEPLQLPYGRMLESKIAT